MSFSQNTAITPASETKETIERKVDARFARKLKKESDKQIATLAHYLTRIELDNAEYRMIRHLDAKLRRVNGTQANKILAPIELKTPQDEFNNKIAEAKSACVIGFYFRNLPAHKAAERIYEEAYKFNKKGHVKPADFFQLWVNAITLLAHQEAREVKKPAKKIAIYSAARAKILAISKETHRTISLAEQTSEAFLEAEAYVKHYLTPKDSFDEEEPPLLIQGGDIDLEVKEAKDLENYVRGKLEFYIDALRGDIDELSGLICEGYYEEAKTFAAELKDQNTIFSNLPEKINNILKNRPRKLATEKIKFDLAILEKKFEQERKESHQKAKEIELDRMDFRKRFKMHRKNLANAREPQRKEREEKKEIKASIDAKKQAKLNHFKLLSEKSRTTLVDFIDQVAIIDPGATITHLGTSFTTMLLNLNDFDEPDDVDIRCEYSRDDLGFATQRMARKNDFIASRKSKAGVATNLSLELKTAADKKINCELTLSKTQSLDPIFITRPRAIFKDGKIIIEGLTPKIQEDILRKIFRIDLDTLHKETKEEEKKEGDAQPVSNFLGRVFRYYNWLVVKHGWTADASALKIFDSTWLQTYFEKTNPATGLYELKKLFEYTQKHLAKIRNSSEPRYQAEIVRLMTTKVGSLHPIVQSFVTVWLKNNSPMKYSVSTIEKISALLLNELLINPNALNLLDKEKFKNALLNPIILSVLEVARASVSPSAEPLSPVVSPTNSAAPLPSPSESSEAPFLTLSDISSPRSRTVSAAAGNPHTLYNSTHHRLRDNRHIPIPPSSSAPVLTYYFPRKK